MAQTKFTEEEFIEMKEILSQITTRIPEDKMGYIWDRHLRITETQEPRPCSCQSAAGLWIKAIDTIRKYISDNDN
jgi:hypothetical protein